MNMNILDTLDTHCQKYNIKITSSQPIVCHNNIHRIRRQAIHIPENINYWNEIDEIWNKTIIENKKRNTLQKK
jgi:hypothetical protein